jgi:hypothetical protein
MAKQAKAATKKTDQNPSIDLGMVSEALRRIRNESDRTHLMIGLIPMDKEPKELLKGSKKYIHDRCDELDKLLGINTKLPA